MKRTEYGVELTKEESRELKQSGYVLSSDYSLCVVDQDGELLLFERKHYSQLSIYDYEEVK